MRVVVLLSIMLLIAPSAMAMGGPPLSVEQNTLWNQYTTAGGCCTSWASTLKDDPAFAGSGNLGTSGTNPDGSFTWVMPLEPALDRVVELDPDATVDSTVHIGSTYGTTPHVGSGMVTVTTQLRLGDQIVAQGSGVDITYLTAQGYEEASWSMTPEITRLDPALGNLEWRVTISGSYSGAYMSHTDSNGNGWITLPIASVIEPALDVAEVFENVTGLPLSIEHSFANATTATHTYNWTHDGGELNVTISGDVRNGTLALRLLDPNGGEAMAGDLAAILAANRTVQVQAPNGTWKIVLEMQEFVGNVSIHADRVVEQERAGEVDENGTLDATDPDKDSPAWSLPAFVLAFGAWIVRRRHAFS